MASSSQWDTAAAAFELLEREARRRQESETYNTTFASIASVVFVLLVLVLPSPGRLVWWLVQGHMVAVICALIGYVLGLVVFGFCWRCARLYGEDLWRQFRKKYARPQPASASTTPQPNPITGEEPTDLLNENLVSLQALQSISPVKKTRSSLQVENTAKRSFFDPAPIRSGEDGKKFLQRIQMLREQEEQEQEQQMAAHAPTSFGSMGMGGGFGSGYALGNPGGIFDASTGPPLVYQATGFEQQAMAHKRALRTKENAFQAVSSPKVAWKQLEESGLQMFMHLYCRNIRRLMAWHLKDFEEAFRLNVVELAGCGVLPQVLERKQAVQAVLCPPGQNDQLINVSLAEMLQNLIHNPMFVSKTRNIYLFEEHLKLEKYLNVGEPVAGQTSSGSALFELSRLERQQYVLERLFLLAKDRHLDAFRWNKGGSWKGKEWSEELPTDAEILMNAFCCLLDNLLPPSNVSDRPFYRAYFLSKPPSWPLPSCLRSRLYIMQAQARPPHFKVLTRGEVKEIVPEEENCFHAMIVFLHAVKKLKAGHLESINLHHILEQVLDVAK